MVNQPILNTYKYQALDNDNHKQQGNTDAPDIHQALIYLISKGLYVYKLWLTNKDDRSAQTTSNLHNVATLFDAQMSNIVPIPLSNQKNTTTIAPRAVNTYRYRALNNNIKQTGIIEAKNILRAIVCLMQRGLYVCRIDLTGANCHQAKQISSFNASAGSKILSFPGLK